MDKLSELTQATVDALTRNYLLLLGVLTLVLVFALYLYFFPKSVDFFENPNEKTDPRLRSEPQARPSIHEA